MDAGATIGDFVDVYCVDKICIGREVTVSQYAFLCTASHNIESPHRELVRSPIEVREAAWIFAGAFISPGVTIGKGAIVAARSVVTRDVPAFHVIGGNPARFIKKRSASWIQNRSPRKEAKGKNK